MKGSGKMSGEVSKNVFRTVKTGNYVAIDNRIVESPVLSWGAKGLLAYMLSRPPGWEFYFSDLVNRATNGPAAVRALLDELREAGFVRLVGREPLPKGRGSKAIWEVYEDPTQNPDGPHSDFHNVVTTVWSSKPIKTNDNKTKDINNAGGSAPANVPEPELLYDIPEEIEAELERQDAIAVKARDNKGWPSDIGDLARAFEAKKGRQALPFEKGYWIHSLRQKYIPAGVSPGQLEAMYDAASKDGITIKSPDSIFYQLDRVHKSGTWALVELREQEGTAVLRTPSGGFVSFEISDPKVQELLVAQKH